MNTNKIFSSMLTYIDELLKNIFSMIKNIKLVKIPEIHRLGLKFKIKNIFFNKLLIFFITRQSIVYSM